LPNFNSTNTLLRIKEVATNIVHVQLPFSVHVWVLFKLLLVIPAPNATSERSFQHQER